MAINWETYRSIPFLRDYAAAKKHHDNTKPIRGDAYWTRPAARRDQKWFSIWEAQGAIHVGYGCRALGDRLKLVTFEPSGSIILPQTRSHGAATHERLSKMLGETFKTHQYDTWVGCYFYDNGVHRQGWLPLPKGKPATFMRQGETDLVFVNYKFPVTHHVDKDKAKEALRPFVPFLTYLEGLAKLQGRALPEFSLETRGEVFGMRDFDPWNGSSKYMAVNSPPSLRWGTDVEQARADFFDLAASDDHMDRLRAAITLIHNAQWGLTSKQAFMEQLMRHRPDDIFEKREHREGKLVKDRYRRYFD